MLAFDTEAASYDSPTRDDAAHQDHCADFLEALGAEVELLEPPLDVYRDHRMAHPGQSFEGRPIIWARIPGEGGGRSLLFNGHYDTVPVGSGEEWSHSPHGEVADARVYGRGACDMKGGNAAALAAVAALVEEEVRLAGDVFVNLVPFEEINGMGTIATMLLGKRADAAICPEPTEAIPLVTSRGVLELAMTVPGRAAHGEVPQPHHSEGGAVNAIDKTMFLLAGLKDLDRQWRTRPDKRHPLLAPPTILPTIIDGGSFWATWPPSVIVVFEVIYLPSDADHEGGGSLVREEIEAYVRTLASTDDWLADHPPTFDWRRDVRPAEVSPAHPLVKLSVDIFGATPGGFDSAADHVYLNGDGKLPAILLGPGSIAQAHTADEFVPITELEKCAGLFAELVAHWCQGP